MSPSDKQFLNKKWIPLSDAAKHTPYTAEYLSLLARLKKINAKKIGRNWHTTNDAIEEYLKKQMVRSHASAGKLKSFTPGLNYQTRTTSFDKSAPIQKKPIPNLEVSNAPVTEKEAHLENQESQKTGNKAKKRRSLPPKKWKWTQIIFLKIL